MARGERTRAEGGADLSRQVVRLSATEKVSAAEEELHAALDSMNEEGEGLKFDWYQNVAKNMDYFEGEQWAEGKRPGKLASVTYNNIWRILLEEIAKVIDLKPVYMIKSPSEDLNPAAAVLSQIATALWQIRGHGSLIPRAVLDLATGAAAFWKVIWNPLLLWGLGDVEVARVSASDVVVDDCESLEQATFIRQRGPVPLWRIKQDFPGVAHLVTADEELSTFMGTPEQVVRQQRPRKSIVAKKSIVQRGMVEEWLVRDPSFVSPMEPSNLKYPAGRLITRCGMGKKVLLQDIPYPWYDPWPGPWVHMSGLKLRGFWPPQEVTNQRELQDILNLFLSILVDECRLMSPGLWIGDQGAVRPEGQDTLLKETSGYVEKKEGRELRRESGQGPSMGMVEMTRMINQMMELLGGIQDAGRVPRGVVAGAALEQVAGAAQAIVRMRTAEIEWGLVQAGYKVLSRILQFYTKPRIALLTGQDGSVLEILFDPAKLKLSDPAEELVKQFVLQVQTTTELAVSKEKGYAMHAALYGVGAIDRKALLDGVEYPNRDEIIKRMEQAEQLGVNRAAAGPTPRGRGTKIIEKML